MEAAYYAARIQWRSDRGGEHKPGIFPCRAGQKALFLLFSAMGVKRPNRDRGEDDCMHPIFLCWD
jgi:hypothetical protein